VLLLAYATIPIWSLVLGFSTGKLISRLLRDIEDSDLPPDQLPKARLKVPYSAIITLLLPASLFLYVCIDYIKDHTGSFASALFGILFGVPFAVGAYKGMKMWLLR
jgi:hypothetical protein